MRAFLLAAFLAAASASELMDPPEIDGWRYSHRLYHGVAGAVIGFATDRVLVACAPSWCSRHPVARRLIDEALVVGAGTAKEIGDRHRGPESLHHSITDLAVTAAGGVVGFELSIRF